MGWTLTGNEGRVTSPAIKYVLPHDMIRYDATGVAAALVEAKAAVLSLRTMPHQRAWVEELQKMELKREVAGTSRIEGAHFTERELDAALRETPEQALNRSQREARAALQAYRWIASLPSDRPIDEELVREIHRRIVTGADDDRCAPGALRGPDNNVVFGVPPHRGAEGGDECASAFEQLVRDIRTRYRGHDPIVQALAAHYHLAAMHPFGDGNGRTARALEALMLQRAGLRDTCFVAMSNYYYEEKAAYLGTLSATRAAGHDLTPFLQFALRGVATQSQRMLGEIRHNVEKGLFRNLMFDLFTRLKGARTRVIAKRQLEILKLLLDSGPTELEDLVQRTARFYSSLKTPRKTVLRDLGGLLSLGAIDIAKTPEGQFLVAVRLEWPTEITESRFFEHVKTLPRAKTHSFLR